MDERGLRCFTRGGCFLHMFSEYLTTVGALKPCQLGLGRYILYPLRAVSFVVFFEVERMMWALIGCFVFVCVKLEEEGPLKKKKRSFIHESNLLPRRN